MIWLTRHMILIIIFLFLTLNMLEAQIYDPERQDLMQPFYMDSTHHDLNFYDFSGNISALLNDSRKMTFLLGYNSQHYSGPFHLPFDAAAANDHDFFFWSVYPISENDLFKGYFGYNLKIENDVLWNDQSGMMETNPFLLGDSSLGNYEMNGLYWAAEWAHKFTDNWQGGFGFFYSVDQRVKDVFPKPYNNHLHTELSFSTQYAIDALAIGINYAYSNKQEKVKISRYSLDQNLTPIIYKFRYSDLPVIMRGSTSEEREMQITGHNLSFQASLKIGNLTVMGEAGGKIKKSETFDGGTERLPEGTFDIQEKAGKLLVDYNRKIFAEYTFRDWLLEADHPLYQDLNVIRRQLASHQLVVGTKFFMLENVPVFADVTYINNFDGMDDRMTINAWRFRHQLAGVRFGLGTPVVGRFSLNTWLAYYLSQIDQVERTENRYSEYFDVLYRDKLNFYLRHDKSGGLGINLKYDYLPLLEVECSFFYSKKMAKLELYRENWLLSIWLKLYIL